VTGASGFIGSRTLRHLVRAGFEVHGVARRVPDLACADIHWHSADLLDREDLLRVVTTVSPSHLLHLAWVATPGEYVDSTLNYDWLSASIRLFRQFQIQGGRRAVVSGTCAEYDWGYGTCSEEKTPLVSSTPYSACKNALRLAVSSMDPLEVAWARVFFAYGPGEPSEKLVSSTIRDFQKGQVPSVGSRDVLRDFVHVEDIALGLTKLLTSDYSGTVNLCTGIATRISEIVALVAESLGQPEAAPDKVRDDTTSPRVVGDVSILRDVLDWQPSIDPVEGVRDTVEQFRRQNL
jgi:UDP-glucuronate decarboxylase